MMAITGLALVGTAGAFGYREMFRGSVLATPPPIITASNEPNKIAPASSEPQAKNSGNARQDGAVTTGSIENLVSREEQPATIEPPKAAPRNSPPRVGASARLLPVRLYRTKRCRAYRWLWILRGLLPCCYVAGRWPIGCSGRHSCSEPRAFGCRPHRTCRSE